MTQVALVGRAWALPRGGAELGQLWPWQGTEQTLQPVGDPTDMQRATRDSACAVIPGSRASACVQVAGRGREVRPG